MSTYPPGDHLRASAEHPGSFLMENVEVAARLEELADLLEIQGANPFRIRAYRNAVRLVRELSRPVREMVEQGEDLTELQGIGEDLDGHIRELLETGGITLLEEVVREVPRSLATLTRLEGLGPKKVSRLWKELGVTTVDELEEAAGSGKVAELGGFGAKSVEKLMRAIEDFRRHQGRFLRTEAEEYLRPVLLHMQDAPGIGKMEVAGSYRRGMETVGDIDLLVALDGAGSSTATRDDDADGQEDSESGTEGAIADAAARRLMDHFTSSPGVDRVDSSGLTRGRVVLRSGLPVDLRILAAGSWGAALHHFTGSREHNVEMRSRARERGLRISEYGVFRVHEDAGEEEAADSGKGGDGRAGEGGPSPEDVFVGGATEEEVFESVGLPWIPPVLREGRGEIRAAAEGTLPDLVEVGDLRGDRHMHSTWSDGRDGIEEMARACLELGYEYMAITDHSRAVTVAGGLGPEELRRQAAEVEEVRERVDGIQILHGCEVDILKDGSLDLPDEALEELDIVLVAVHSYFNLDKSEQTDRVIRALENPLVDILVHPTGRLLGRREPYAIDMEAVLEAARECEVAVELNSNPRRLDLHDRHLFRARELGVTVSIATDAHRADRLDRIECGVVQARRGWLESGNVLNTRSRSELRAWLGRRR
jgi:DNA polymerase (family X)